MTTVRGPAALVSCPSCGHLAVAMEAGPGLLIVIDPPRRWRLRFYVDHPEAIDDFGRQTFNPAPGDGARHDCPVAERKQAM